MKILQHYSHENVLHIEYIDETSKKVKYKHADLQKWYDSEPTWTRPKTLFPMTADTAIYIINNYHEPKHNKTKALIKKIAFRVFIILIIWVLYEILGLTPLTGNLI